MRLFILLLGDCFSLHVITNYCIRLTINSERLDRNNENTTTSYTQFSYFYLAVSPRYEKVVSNTGLTVFSSLHSTTVLGVVVQVSAVGQGEGARLQLLVELSPTEPILLLYILSLESRESNLSTDHTYAGRVVQVIEISSVT